MKWAFLWESSRQHIDLCIRFWLLWLIMNGKIIKVTHLCKLLCKMSLSDGLLSAKFDDPLLQTLQKEQLVGQFFKMSKLWNKWEGKFCFWYLPHVNNPYFNSLPSGLKAELYRAYIFNCQLESFINHVIERSNMVTSKVFEVFR